MSIIKRNEQDRSLSRPRFWDPLEMVQSMMHWDPFRALTQPVSGQEGGFVPSFELKETKDAFIFKADLPGLREEDLDVSVTGSRITISGQRQEEKKEDTDRYFAFERSYGSFSRSFTLPEGVDPDNIQAELKDGVLTLQVPKRPEVQPRKVLLKSSQTERKAKA